MLYDHNVILPVSQKKTRILTVRLLSAPPCQRDRVCFDRILAVCMRPATSGIMRDNARNKKKHAQETLGTIADHLLKNQRGLLADQKTS